MASFWDLNRKISTESEKLFLNATHHSSTMPFKLYNRLYLSTFLSEISTYSQFKWPCVKGEKNERMK